MKPVLFTIPGINWDIPGYGLMLTLAFLLSIGWALRRAIRSGANPDIILDCGFLALIGGVVGCRIMYVIHYWEQFKNRGNFLEILFAIVDVRKGGLEFYGGFVLSILLVLYWLARVKKVSVRWYFDILAPSCALGLAIGRIGCYLNGCCYGGVCTLPWAVTFPFGSNPQISQWTAKAHGSELPKELLYTFSGPITQPLTRESLAATDSSIAAADATFATNAVRLKEIQNELKAAPDKATQRKLNREQRKLAQQALQHLALRTNMRKYDVSAEKLRTLAAEHRSLPVHPTQLYSTITALLVALFLNALYWRRSRDGQVMFTLLLIEPVTRWLLEVIRADNPVDTLGAFTISQFLAVCMTLTGLIGLIMLSRMPPRSPHAELWEPPEEKQADAKTKPAN